MIETTLKGRLASAVARGQLARIGRVVACSGALLAFGLWFGGAGSRIEALTRSALLPCTLSPIPGSQASPPRSCAVDGSPSVMRRCVAPHGVSAGAVSAHYVSIARAESTLPGLVQTKNGPVSGFPLIATDDATGMHVVWTSTQDGHRKGVIISEDAAGLVTYTLIESEPLDDEPLQGRPVLLPGGIRAPDGSRPGVLFDTGDTGLGCFEVAGAPPEAAQKLVRSLEAAGYSVDERTLGDLDAVNPGRRLVVPFRGNKRSGWVVLSSAHPGVTRATLTLR